MSDKITISICLDDLYAASKASHPQIKTGKNGKKYATVDVWIGEADQYGNQMSVSLYDKENKKPTYIGNGKLWDGQTVTFGKAGQAAQSQPQPSAQQAFDPNMSGGLPF